MKLDWLNIYRLADSGAIHPWVIRHTRVNLACKFVGDLTDSFLLRQSLMGIESIPIFINLTATTVLEGIQIF